MFALVALAFSMFPQMVLLWRVAPSAKYSFSGLTRRTSRLCKFPGMCDTSFDAPAVLARAVQREAPAAHVLRALQEIEQAPPSAVVPASTADLDGSWELIFSSAAAKLPFVDGYMPNREVLTWNLELRRLELEIETLPFLPKISVIGENLDWDEQAQTLTYTVNEKPPSQWQILNMDRDNGIIAARSSVTGLNIIRRLRGGFTMGANMNLVPAFLARIAQVNDCSMSPKLTPFLVDGLQAGSISPAVLAELSKWPDVFDCSDSSSVTLSKRLGDATLEERNAAVHEVALALRECGMIKKWRDETLALTTGFNAKPSLLVERRFLPLLGGRGYGVAVNGYTRYEDEEYLWVATRAADKATWPGMLDTLAAGAVPAGSSAFEAACNEAAEEAGVPAELAAAALKAVGAVSYRGVDEDPVLPKDDVFFVFDLELPWDFVPRIVDGEVERFERMLVAEVAHCIAYGSSPGFPCLVEQAGDSNDASKTWNAYKPNINLVLIDFLVRHGHIPPESPGYLELIANLRQGRVQVNLAHF